MANSIKRLLSMALIATVAAGCASTPPTRFYTLASTASADGGPAVRGGILIGSVTVPSAVNRPQFVVQTSPNQVEVEDFDIWAAPLDDSIGRVIAGDLAVLLGTPDVAQAPFANFDAAWRVTIGVQRFESVPGDSALVEAVWAVRRTADDDSQSAGRSGRTVARETPQGKDFVALAAAHSRALAKVSADIAAAIRGL